MPLTVVSEGPYRFHNDSVPLKIYFNVLRRTSASCRCRRLSIYKFIQMSYVPSPPACVHAHRRLLWSGPANTHTLWDRSRIEKWNQWKCGRANNHGIETRCWGACGDSEPLESPLDVWGALGRSPHWSSKLKGREERVSLIAQFSVEGFHPFPHSYLSRVFVEIWDVRILDKIERNESLLWQDTRKKTRFWSFNWLLADYITSHISSRYFDWIWFLKR